jgi:hypothetical protein
MSEASQSPQPTESQPFIKSDIDRALFLGSPHIDSLFLALQSLAAEVWITRRRAYIVESLLAQNRPVTRETIEQYVETPDETRRWKEECETLIANMYEPFLRPGDLPFASKEAQGLNRR